MQYRIAELVTTIPAAGDMVPRCKEYIWNSSDNADIVITEDLFRPTCWPNLTKNEMIYLETGIQFYKQLLYYNGIMLHASAVEMDGKAYLFSGSCGAGKSTHTQIWKETFGERAQVFNDDKPALRRLDDGWFVYGTPWSGKNGINQNKKVPLAGICFLKKDLENSIRRLSAQEALPNVVFQTMHRFTSSEKMGLMLSIVDRLLEEIPIFELKNRPESEAARLSYKAMKLASEEA